MSFFSSSLLLFVHSHDLLLCLETAVLAQVSKDCSGESQAAHYCYSQILLLLYYNYKDPALCGDLCCLCSYYCLRLHVFIDPKTAPPSAVVPLRIPTPAPISILCCLVFFFIVPVSIVVVVVGQCRS